MNVEILNTGYEATCEAFIEQCKTSYPDASLKITDRGQYPGYRVMLVGFGKFTSSTLEPKLIESLQSYAVGFRDGYEVWL